MSDYLSRKAARVAHYQEFVNGWKLRACSACSGSGYYCGGYCGACGGSGKERFKPEDKKCSSASSAKDH